MKSLILAALSAVPCEHLPEAPSAGPIYGLLVGYGGVPPGTKLEPLRSVEQDVLRLMTALGNLGAKALYVHVRPSSVHEPRYRNVRLRLPRLYALDRSVNDLVETIVAEGGDDAQVFVFYAGHGLRQWRGGRERTRIFLEPTDTPIPHDGVLDPKTFSRVVLRPLSAVATVHVVIDACQSFFILEPRGTAFERRSVKVRPNSGPGLEDAFLERFTTVGAVLATNGSQLTYEHPELGGLFSYAVVSALIGPGDLDQDGRLTYGELRRALSQVLAGVGPEPGLIGVGGRDDSTFMSYRGRGLAKVCLAATPEQRIELLDFARVPHAVLHSPTERMSAIYLPAGSVWEVMARPAQGTRQRYRIRVQPGAFDEQPRLTAQFAARGQRLSVHWGAPLPRPLDPALSITQPAPRSPPPPDGYLGLAVGGVLRASPSAPENADLAAGTGFALRLGAGRHHALLGGRWSRGSGALEDPESPGSTRPFEADSFAADVGYGAFLIDTDPIELAAGVAVGANWTIRRFEDAEFQDDEGVALMVAGRLSGLIPLGSGSPWALLVQLEGGAEGRNTTDAVGRESWVTRPVYGGLIGLEHELPL